MSKSRFSRKNHVKAAYISVALVIVIGGLLVFTAIGQQTPCIVYSGGIGNSGGVYCHPFFDWMLTVDGILGLSAIAIGASSIILMAKTN